MNFLKRNRGKVWLAVIVVILLAFTLCENTNNIENAPNEPQIEEVIEDKNAESKIVAEEPEEKLEESSEQEPSKLQEEKEELYCTLSVSCDTILKDISQLNENKRELVGNGIIFPRKKVEFKDGESVFDVLLREMKENKIHLEFVNTPVYGSVYIEGIGNIYEFDAGELSGWMYKVNGEFPNYGCSKYILKNGDRVEFVYTCDLGKDVGNSYPSNNGG